MDAAYKTLSAPELREQYDQHRKRNKAEPISKYELLGVLSEASPAQLKDGYVALRFHLHPDRQEGRREATDRFKEIFEAFDTLRAPLKRREYDAFLRKKEKRALPHYKGS